MACMWDRAFLAESIGSFYASKMSNMLGSGGVGLVGGTVTEGGSAAAASVSTTPVVSFVCRGSE